MGINDLVYLLSLSSTWGFSGWNLWKQHFPQRAVMLAAVNNHSDCWVCTVPNPVNQTRWDSLQGWQEMGCNFLLIPFWEWLPVL